MTRDATWADGRHTARRLVDAGPHPNRAFARRGMRLQRLGVDPECGPIVKWIFSQRLAEHSLSRIARALNDAAIPCPSAADPDGNPHRTAERWTATTVRAILANPRYTGRQVWNRQRTDHELIDPDNTTLGTRDVMRWDSPEDWAISRAQAPPALVSESDFVAVQHIRAARETLPGRTYQLAGTLRCGLCGRCIDSHWVHERPGYRCRHGHTSAAADPSRRRNAYIREDQVLAHLPALLIRLAAATEGPNIEPMPCGSRQAASASDAVEQLRASAIALTYDPVARTLTADTDRAERILIG